MSVLYLKNNQGIWEEVSTINGHTPVITASKSNGITTIYADGTTVATINDGEKGEKGEDGETPLSAFPNDTASGQIVHITDGADDIPMDSVKVNIEPVQDLNGQDAPYPAGGRKNLLPFPYTIGSGRTVNGVTATVSSDGIVTLNGTATAQAEFPLIATYIDLPTGTYTLSGLPSGGSATTFVYNAYAFDEDDTILFDYRITSSRTVTVNSPIKRMYIYIRVVEGYTANNLVVKPQFEEGSTATSYAPYSNICPISGWIGAQVVRAGRNLWNLGDISATRKHQDNLTLFSGTYTFSAVATSEATGTNARIVLWDTNMQLLGTISIPHDGVRHSGTITVSNPVGAVELWAGESASVSNGKAFTFSDVQAELGSTATAYEPYTGQTYDISFPTEAGTVYGGELDITNGILTVDRGYYTVTNATILKSEGAYTDFTRWTLKQSGDTVTGKPNGAVISNVFAHGTLVKNGTFCHGSTGAVNITPQLSIGTAEQEVLTWLIANNVQLCYELATPITYTLTPTEIKSLYGENNIYADCGSTSVTYRADTTSYIGKIITATKSGTVTTVYVKDKPIATINDGTNGKDYTLTTQDKADIAQQVISTLPTAQGVSF